MKRTAFLSCAAGVVLAATAIAPAVGAQQAQQQQPTVAKTNLKVGDVAPDFSLKDHTGKKVSLRSYRGKKNVVLAFYVLAHTGG